MNENHIILRDEFPATEQRIKEFETSKNIRFPDDYRKFLLEYNGGVIIPNHMPSLNVLERLYSLGDIEFGFNYHPRERELRECMQMSIEGKDFDIELDKLMFIGICEGGGHLHLYCGENGNGAIYESNYSGGGGFMRTGLKSFTELLEGMFYPYDDWEFDKNAPAYKNWTSDKIYRFFTAFYWQEDIKEHGLERFKEVLAFYGDPNKVHPDMKTNIVTLYRNNPTVSKYLMDLENRRDPPK